MEMYKGLVFSMDKRTAVVTTQQHAVYKISRNNTMYIGKEIMFSDKDIVDYRYFIKRYSVVAASLFLVVGVAIGFLLNFNKSFLGVKEYAYISMDINPSMEFTINDDQKVLKVNPLNSDADEIIEGEKFRGMEIEDAFVKVYGICEDIGIIEDEVCVLISGSINPDKKENQDVDNSIENILGELKQSIENTSDFEAEIVAIEIESKLREQAFKNDMSPSKYALYSEIRKRGEDISIEEIKKSSTKELVKIYNNENKENGDSSKMVSTPEPTFDKGTALASPTFELTPTPIVTQTPEVTPTPTPIMTETPVPIVESTLQLPVVTKNVSTQTPEVTLTPALTPTPTPTPTPTQTIKPTKTKVKLGTGLRGEYFDNIDLTNFKLTRVDETIDFYWGIYPPAYEIRDDETYSVRWSGKIRPTHSEEYTFYVARDNGVRLWVDNKLIVDKWDSDTSFGDTGKIYLKANKFYDIRLEYFNNCGDGILKLEWSSKNTMKNVVPVESLYPSEAKNYASNIQGNGIGLRYEYFDEDNLTNFKEKGIDSIIDFNWGVGSPSRSIDKDQKFSARWTGYIQAPYDEDYVFYVTYDDGASLWVDKQLIVDKWNVSEINTVKSTPITLKAGQKVEIVLIYHNNSLAGQVKLEWESPNIKRSVVPKSCLHPW